MVGDLLVASNSSRILLQVSVQICSVFEARICGPAFLLLKIASAKGEENKRYSILLGIPVSCALEAFAGSLEVVLLLQVYLRNLLLAICCLAETPALGKVRYGLSQCLDGHCALCAAISSPAHKSSVLSPHNQETLSYKPSRHSTRHWQHH